MILGDAVHNYMATLDHLVYQLALLEANPPKCKPQFPIFLTQDDFKKSGARGRRLGCLNLADQKRIIALQPFSERPSDPENHPLMQLYQLEIEDKHNLLLFTAVSANFKLMARPADLEIVEAREFLTQEALKRRSLLARYEVRQTGPNPELIVEAQGTFDVVFDNSSPCGGLPVLLVLDGIRKAVTRAVAQFNDRFPLPTEPATGWGYEPTTLILP